MPVAEERGVTKARAKTCPCEACKKGRGAPSKVAYSTIHSYNSQPRYGWQKKQKADEPVTPTLFMGVELETSVMSPGSAYDRSRDVQGAAISAELVRRFPEPVRPIGERYDDSRPSGYSEMWEAYMRERNTVQVARMADEAQLWGSGFGRPKDKASTNSIEVNAEEAASLALPEEFWHAKHDGSVSGPEFASQPASLEYWYSIRSELDMMFTSLLHAGVRSHVGDEAGMHISISLESFADSEHLMRMSKLINGNPRWTQRMSQRTDRSMHWCALGQGSFRPGADLQLRRWAERVMTQGENHSEDRYSALNAQCGGQGRIEFRVPRGTLRLDRFYKNLEWVAAMIEFTANYEATDSATFMRWVMAQGTRFGDLQKWLTEKFRLQPSTVEFSPRRAVPSERAVANMVGVRGTSDRSERCPCGDGCEDGDCDSCAEDFEDDEGYGACLCGSVHDRGLESYVFWAQGMDRHYESMYGNLIGPPRRYRPDGTEYNYREDGQPIFNEAVAETPSQTVVQHDPEPARPSQTDWLPLILNRDSGTFVPMSSFVIDEDAS